MDLEIVPPAKIKILVRAADSAADRKSQRKELGLRKYERTTTYEIVCKICGNTSIAKSPGKMYCSVKCRASAGNKTEARKKALKEKYSACPVYRMKVRVKSRLAKALKARGWSKTDATKNMLGCGYQEFVEHIEKNFSSGMTWENRDKWHLDHIIPLATAKTKEDIVRLTHHSNLRPMWARDNMAKGAKIEAAF